MSETCEQKARDLLERLSGCTYYDDPQQLSAGDVVELAQMFAEIERLNSVIAYAVNQTFYAATHGGMSEREACMVHDTILQRWGNWKEVGGREGITGPCHETVMEPERVGSKWTWRKKRGDDERD